jgi:hypothetical protein
LIIKSFDDDSIVEVGTLSVLIGVNGTLVDDKTVVGVELNIKHE